MQYKPVILPSGKQCGTHRLLLPLLVGEGAPAVLSDSGVPHTEWLLPGN